MCASMVGGTAHPKWGLGRGGSRILGKGGSAKYIHNLGEGTGGGVPPPVTARGFWGSADSSPSGVWGEAPAAFLLLRLFSMKFTVISNTYTSLFTRYPDY